MSEGKQKSIQDQEKLPDSNQQGEIQDQKEPTENSGGLPGSPDGLQMPTLPPLPHDEHGEKEGEKADQGTARKPYQGSIDPIEDVADYLDKLGIAYMLATGVQGQDHTRVYSNVEHWGGLPAGLTMLEAFNYHLSEVFKEDWEGPNDFDEDGESRIIKPRK